MPRPIETDLPAYVTRYISKVTAPSVSEAVVQYADQLADFYTQLPESKAGYSYAPGKWTVKEVLQHVIDAERIFSYRILRIARKDKTPLPSFDENTFAENSRANTRSFYALKEEFIAVRKATDLLITSLSEEQLAAEGTAGNLTLTANAIGYIAFGHLLHHRDVLEEKYLGIR